MESAQNGGSDQIQTEDYRSFSEISPSLNKQTIGSFSGISSQKGFLESSGQLGGVENKAQAPKKPKRSFFKCFIKPPRRPGFPNLGSPILLVSPSATFQKIANERDGISRSTPTPAPLHGLKDGVKVPFVGEIRWVYLKEAVKEWLRNPKNLALLIWGIAVAVSGAILFLVLVGFLNKALPKKSQRDAWFEVNNQILNALFTMMCLYQHPQRCYHLSLLYRWKPEDILILRKVYCKNETYKPHEWAHMMVVVLLLQVNCFAQYALCGLNWGYKRSERPAIGVGLCVAVAIGAPAAAGFYLILSPLGKDYESEGDLETRVISITDADIARTDDNSVKSKSTYARLEKKYSLLLRGSKRMDPKPEWQGGLFDCWSNPSVAFFSTFCGFCLFGWNMARLGFGNMYVHIVTFILVCMAPYWIFSLAAVNIDNENIREGLAITGIILCVFGLLYGGFWRIQMRKRFGLPGNRWCCGQPNMTDLVQWLFCSVCSLSQEVRTGNFYEVCDEKLYSRQYLGQDSQDPRDTSPRLVPLGHEPGSPAVLSPAVNSPSRVKSGMPALNAQASVSPVLSPMHYSVANSLPPQGLSLVREVSTFPLSNFLTAETHIAISPASESEDAHSVAAQTENPKTDGDPMNAPIPLNLER